MAIFSVIYKIKTTLCPFVNYVKLLLKIVNF